MKIEWQKIRRELQYFLIALSACLILVIISLYYHNRYYSDWQKQKRQLTQASIRYQQSLDRKALLEAYESSFESLKKHGVFGDEQRVQWIETIQASSEKRGIPSVKFDISRRSKLDKGDLEQDVTGIDIYASRMKLEFELLHEGDLFNLFSDMDDRAHGLNMANRCRINNSTRGESVLENRSAFNFTGECQLIWFSFDEERAEQEDDNDNS